MMRSIQYCSVVMKLSIKTDKKILNRIMRKIKLSILLKQSNVKEIRFPQKQIPQISDKEL